jgi:Kef-type K+ transport system membrane component KefB
MIPLLVLVALAGLMHTTHGFTPDHVGGAPEMAFGYLLLSAYFAGNLCARVGMPKLTGYILVGVAVGPSALGLVDPATMGGLRIVGDVATAMIALAGGAELELKVMRPLLRTVVSMIGWAVLGTMLVLTVTLCSIRPLVPFLDALSFTDAVAVAAVLAVTLAAQSPAVVMALIGETRSGGSVTRTVLAVVILADLVVVLVYGVVSAVGTAVIGGHADVAAVASAIGWEIGGSFVVGLAIGVVMARYLIQTSGGIGLFTIMVCVVVSQVAAAVHLDALVVMLTAGIYLQNRSRAPVHKLIDSFEGASLPIYLVFFALAGAKVDLKVLATLAIPVAILVCARTASFLVGSRIAARRSDAPDAIRSYAWFGLLPQAGLALALAELLRETFPTFGDQAFALVLGVVGANQILGPILLRVALVRSGEAGKGSPHDSQAP